MPDVFDNIFGQPQVRDFLRASIAGDKVGHAYLFVGPIGSNKTMAAYAFAQAIICKEKGCQECDSCKRVMRRKHPDVRYCAPEGVGGYLVDQLRGIVHDTTLAPIQADKKVYILDRVDLLSFQSANAFLKTLEEPPDDVIFILLGRTHDSVLPTIVSRCLVVPFRHIPASEAAGILMQNSGCSKNAANIAIQACGGSITKAMEFLKSNERMAFRARVLQVLENLELADDWDVLGYAQELVVSSKAPLDIVRASQEAELAASADFLEKSAIRQIEAKNKRMLSAQALESLHQIVSIIRSWVRDVMMACAGCPELIINDDARSTIEYASQKTNEALTIRVLDACRSTDEAIAYNVSPETSIDALLFEIREGIYGSHCANPIKKQPQNTVV